MSISTRRQFFVQSGLATLGAAITIGVGLNPAHAISDDEGFEEMLETALSNPNIIKTKRLMANLISNPALVTLAQNIRQNNDSSLTNFKRSLIDAFLISTPHSAAIVASLTGKTLTNAERSELDFLAAGLSKNGAMRRLKSAGHALKNPKDSALLQTYVNQAMAADIVPLPIPTTLGDPNLDAVVADIFNLRSSTAYQSVVLALTPLSKSPGFLPALRKQPSTLVSGFTPMDIQLAFLLPVDKDPFTPATIDAVFAVILAVLGSILVAVQVPLALAVTSVLAFVIAGVALGFAFFQLFKSIDCDFDGDPNDPEDVPGVECPA
jgi:hypothetical protein